MIWTLKRMSTLRNESNAFGRVKAVRAAAELLRCIGTAFFPLEHENVVSRFKGQILLFTYEAIKDKGALQAAGLNIDPKDVSKDGFCLRLQDSLIRSGEVNLPGSKWNVFYEDNSQPARIRFTLMHEIGHIMLGHHQQLEADALIGLEGDPRYRLADAQADAFSISALAPAPAVYRLLHGHGFSCVIRKGLPSWELTDPDALFLRNLGNPPNPEELVMTAFGLSQAAAHRRLMELASDMKLWDRMDPELYAAVENIPHRSGWYCHVCNTRRRTSSLYCPGCGAHHYYEYKDFGKFSPPVIGLRENGQFEFCSVCGNDQYPEDALFCPICGCPIVNECENAYTTDGDFIRSGMWVVRGTHRCKASDIYCGKCGVVTAFGRRYGPKENMWTKHSKERRRMAGTRYPRVFDVKDGRLQACPACGSTRTMRDGRYCADCMQPLQNVCTSGKGEKHFCGLEDRYCPICGQPTVFFQAGFLPEYKESETFQHLLKTEGLRENQKQTPLVIKDDGRIADARKEEQEWLQSVLSQQELPG